MEFPIHTAHLQLATQLTPLAGPLIGATSLVTAIIVAWIQWLRPFKLSIIARPFVWRLGPFTPHTKSFEVVFWTTVANLGARSGSVDDLALEVVFPKTRWFLQPIAFVRSDDYFQIQFGRSFQFPPVEGPFTPLFLAGRSQVTKAIMFLPATGEDKDFDPALVESGVHEVRLFARVRGDNFNLVSTQKLVLEADVLAQWRQGESVSGMINHRDRPTPELLS